MNWVEILVLSLGLAMDAGAVSLAAAAAGTAPGPRAAFRLSFHFGLFQFLMPLAGWAVGAAFASHIATFDHWVAFALLAFLGGRMIRSGLHEGGNSPQSLDPTRGWQLIALSIATSIDALAVGLSLALLGARILTAAIVIGVVAAVVSLTAFVVGRHLGSRVGPRMSVAGGVFLLLVGGKILADHLIQ